LNLKDTSLYSTTYGVWMRQKAAARCCSDTWSTVVAQTIQPSRANELSKGALAKTERGMDEGRGGLDRISVGGLLLPNGGRSPPRRGHPSNCSKISKRHGIGPQVSARRQVSAAEAYSSSSSRTRASTCCGVKNRRTIPPRLSAESPYGAACSISRFQVKLPQQGKPPAVSRRGLC
jgi:hypothetical protein